MLLLLNMATWHDGEKKKTVVGKPSLFENVIAKRPKEVTNNDTAPITPSKPEGVKPPKTPPFTPAEAKG